MIFGFNTDVQRADTIYHVQSEARESDLLLQTQIFVRGRCIGKHATSYAEQAAHPSFSEQRIHELLKEQHRSVLDAVREGRLGALLAGRAAIRDAGSNGLALECLSTNAALDAGLRMRFLVTYHGEPVAGAHLTLRLASADDAPIHAHAVTTADGVAEVGIKFQDPNLREIPVLVQAVHDKNSATRKFRLRKNGS